MSEPILLPYQRAWIADKATVRVWEKSRRIGASWAAAAESVLYAAQRKPKQHVAYIGYNRDMTTQFVEDCAAWAKALQVWSHHDTSIIDEKTGILRHALTFAGGNRITALSSRPKNFRSRGGMAILDEAAFHEDLEELLAAVTPLTIWGGRVMILSTQYMVDGAFNRLVQAIREKRVAYSLHRTTFDDAIEQGLYRRICKIAGREWSLELERAWRDQIIQDTGDAADRELFCVPSRSGGQYIDGAVIERASSVDPAHIARFEAPRGFVSWPDNERIAHMKAWLERELLPRATAEHRRRRLKGEKMWTIGEDFARHADLTVLACLAITRAARFEVPLVVELGHCPYEQQTQAFEALVKILKPRRIKCDATGNGGYLAERATQLFGASVVEEVTITRAWYADTMPPMKAALEDNKLTIPRDLSLAGDLASIILFEGLPHLPRLSTASKSGERRRHGDFAIALALAHEAARECSFAPGLTRPDAVGDRLKHPSTHRAMSGIHRGGGLW
jgi:phage FluMu gp28-like protein